MRILFVAAEAAPLAKVGGLADVVGSLPKALTKLGHDVRLILPKYGSIKVDHNLLTPMMGDFPIRVMGKTELAGVKLMANKSRFPVYLIENQKYFGAKEIYSKNDLERFLFFSRAISQMLPNLDWRPQIVHCHDWHTALLVMWLRKAGYPSGLIFTIHNLAYQGFFDDSFLNISKLREHWEDYPHDAPLPPFNFMSQGILWADLVTTVSETYAKEIITPEQGAGLDHLLRYRQENLLGIINGIDSEEYNPETDPFIEANYGISTLEKRVSNKLALQKKAGLSEGADIPLIGMVGRLEEQKGMDILLEAMGSIFEETRAQLVILGTGNENYHKMLKELAAEYPERMALFLTFDNSLAHLIYAGCDMFLMPSRFEPCGLGQLIAMRYGTLPIVRHTGGLADTVTELTPDLAKGSGFVFQDYTADDLLLAVKTASDSFGNRSAWQKAMKRVMMLDFSWETSARKYDAIYQQVWQARKFKWEKR